MTFRARPTFVDRIDAQSMSEGMNRTEWIIKTLGTALDASHRRIAPSLQGRPVIDRDNPSPLEREVP